jgi:hypothetical protein
MDIWQWVLTNNYFIANDEIYRQLQGVAMGTNGAPEYANLFMAFYEFQLKRQGTFPSIYKRYIDDAFFVWTGTKESCSAFLDKVNTISPSIKIKASISETKVDFLDLTIYLEDIPESKLIKIKPTINQLINTCIHIQAHGIPIIINIAG